MDGTKRSNIKIGATVLVVQKQDQRTGKRKRQFKHAYKKIRHR